MANDTVRENLATFVAHDKAFGRAARRAGLPARPYTPSGSCTARWAVAAATQTDIARAVRLTKAPVAWEEHQDGWLVFLAYPGDAITKVAAAVTFVSCVRTSVTYRVETTDDGNVSVAQVTRQRGYFAEDSREWVALAWEVLSSHEGAAVLRFLGLEGGA